MRRLSMTILLLLATLGGSASAQTAERFRTVRYAFSEEADWQTLTFDAATPATLSLDCTHLKEGLQQLHVQIVNDDQTLSPVNSALFIYLGKTAQTSDRVQWWFDQGSPIPTDIPRDGILHLDGSALWEGFHTVHFQIISKNNSPGPVKTSTFLHFGASAQQSGFVQWWFDQDVPKKVAIPKSGLFQLDCSHLWEGLHTVNYQIIGADGSVGSPQSSTFLYFGKALQAAEEIEWWFDDETSRRTLLATSDTHEIDCTSLLSGMHVIHFQSKGNDGTTNPVRSQSFYVNNGDFNGQYLVYWFDDPSGNTRRHTLEHGVNTIEASELSEGEHTLYVAITSRLGMLTSTEIKNATIYRVVTGISLPESSTDSPTPTYRLDGRRTSVSPNGIVIQKGKKIFLK